MDFASAVDNFLIQHKKDSDLEHLRLAIEEHCMFKVDTDAEQHVGVHLKWDDKNCTVRPSMDGHIEQALKEFEHVMPKNRHHSPSKHEYPRHRSRAWCTKIDESELLSLEQITFIQQVMGKLLHHARAVDPTMLHAINDVSLTVSKGTEETMKAVVHSLNCASAHPNAKIIHRASDMIPHADSDAACLVTPEA